MIVIRIYALIVYFNFKYFKNKIKDPITLETFQELFANISCKNGEDLPVIGKLKRNVD